MPDNNELEKLIPIEIDNLERLSREMNQLLGRDGSPKTSIEVRGAGSILHDFYCGMEKIFERITVSIDKKNPTGLNWHSELLSQMLEPIEGVREGVVNEELYKKLKEYLRFRHLFRNIYGFELKWERLESLCHEMESTFRKFKEQIQSFIECQFLDLPSAGGDEEV